MVIGARVMAAIFYEGKEEGKRAKGVIYIYLCVCVCVCVCVHGRDNNPACVLS